MAVVYRGNRAYYLDEETNTLWSSPDKKHQFDIDTTEPIVSVPKTPVEPVVVVVEKNPLECHCGYVAKSNAGLAVHKLKHKVV